MTAEGASTASVRRRLRITGHVQGVFYRAWFVDQARTLGLVGWVRNRADGSVEAVIEGSAARVEAMIERARQGSPDARVERVAVTEEERGEPLASFVQRATA